MHNALHTSIFTNAKNGKTNVLVQTTMH